KSGTGMRCNLKRRPTSISRNDYKTRSKKIITLRSKKYLYSTGYLQILILIFSLFLGINSHAQDSTATGSSMGRIHMPNPPSIKDFYTYDPITDRYIFSRKLGDFRIDYPLVLTPEEHQQLIRKGEMKAYFKEKIDAMDGRKKDAEDQQKNLLPTFYVNSGFFESVFGGNTIDVLPQGSVEMDLGILYTKQDNPQFSPRNR